MNAADETRLAAQSSTRLEIRKLGNSTGLIFPKELLARLTVAIVDAIHDEHFLGLNGIDFIVPEPAAASIILALAAGDVDEESLTRWIRDNRPKSL
jgi:antitoxin component of MazEF toxin-antitoxin module